MKLFKCQHCGQLLHFENRVCEKCQHRLGYLPRPALLRALEPHGEAWQVIGLPAALYRFCANAEHDVCNWLIAIETPEIYCRCCRHNRTIPDVSIEENLIAWRKIEAAKHRLFYSLLRLQLPLANRADAPDNGLAFDFLAGPMEAPQAGVMTGHDNGLITIAIAEADDVERERRRTLMHEPYRTLVGHFRHESGHYFWDRLVRDGGRLEACRAVFGDERVDYGEALKAYYDCGAPADWQARFVSAYATSHPWEDFAETWAHYLHIVDTLELAGAFGMSVHPRLAHDPSLAVRVDFDPYGAEEITPLTDAWIPLSIALNSLNRTMGQPDLYPFVLAPPVIDKLAFIHALVHGDREHLRPP